MNCPKHPKTVMTALFTGVVCDLCSPPKTTTVASHGVANGAVSYSNGVDAENYVRCPTCGERATQSWIGRAACLKGHAFGHTFKKGHRIETSKLAGFITDREWDGSAFTPMAPLSLVGGVDARNYILCPLCGMRAITAHLSAVGGTWDPECPNGHRFKHRLQLGHRVALSAKGYLDDREWDGHSWISCPPQP